MRLLFWRVTQLDASQKTATRRYFGQNAKQRLDAIPALARRVSPWRALDFLKALANARDEESYERLAQSFPAFVPERKPATRQRGGAWVGVTFPQDLAADIRRAWREKNLASREWSLSLALALAHELYSSNRAPWLARTIVALNTAQRSADRLGFCERAYQDCPAPFFTGKRKYCGEACARAATRQRSLNWWNRNKEPLLQERKRKRKEARERKKLQKRQRRKTT